MESIIDYIIYNTFIFFTKKSIDNNKTYEYNEYMNRYSNERGGKSGRRT